MIYNIFIGSLIIAVITLLLLLRKEKQKKEKQKKYFHTMNEIVEINKHPIKVQDEFEFDKYKFQNFGNHYRNVAIKESAHRLAELLLEKHYIEVEETDNVDELKNRIRLTLTFLK